RAAGDPGLLDAAVIEQDLLDEDALLAALALVTVDLDQRPRDEHRAQARLGTRAHSLGPDAASLLVTDGAPNHAVLGRLSLPAAPGLVAVARFQVILEQLANQQERRVIAGVKSPVRLVDAGSDLGAHDRFGLHGYSPLSSWYLV